MGASDRGNAWAKKLGWETVRSIRAAYAAGDTTLQDLADEYGLCRMSVRDVVHNEVWRDPEYSPPPKRSWKTDPESRFWKRVDKSGPTSCWIWAGAVKPNGYGQFSPRREKSVGAHRYSYELHNGPIPEGLLVCHKCDVRNCVNPDHLFPGTHKDNMQDASRKGRLFSHSMTGESNPSARISMPIAEEIRAGHAAGASQSSLARQFGVSRGTIRNVITNRMWVPENGD